MYNIYNEHDRKEMKDMTIHIDFNSDEAIYIQLRNQIVLGIAKEEMNFKKDPESMNKEELTKLIADIQKKMQRAAADLNFEAAAEYRDQMLQLKTMLQDL